MTLSEPELFAGYALVGKIATGGSGELFFARPPPSSGLPPLVALKRLREDWWSDQDAQRRFRHEAQVFTHLDSPCLARIFDVGAVGETPYFVMELIDGWTLAEVITTLAAERMYPPFGWVLAVALDILEALRVLHEAGGSEGPLGLVHRDVNPKNAIFGADGRTRLIDLGLGRSTARDWKTRTGAVMGTPGYLSPEQALGTAVDARSDLYAVGVLLYELTTLAPFVRRGSAAEMLRASAAPSFVPPRTRRPELPVEAEAVLLRTLRADVAERYSSARELSAALERSWPPSRDSGVRALLDRVRPRPDLTAFLEAPAPEASEPEEATVVFSRVAPRPPGPAVAPRSSRSRPVGMAVVLAGVGLLSSVSWYALFSGEGVPAQPAPAAVPVAVPRPAAASDVRPEVPQVSAEGAAVPARQARPRSRAPEAPEPSEARAGKSGAQSPSSVGAPTIAAGRSPTPAPVPGPRLEPSLEESEVLRVRALELLRRLDSIPRSSPHWGRAEALTFELLAQRRSPDAGALERLVRDVAALEREAGAGSTGPK